MYKICKKIKLKRIIAIMITLIFIFIDLNSYHNIYADDINSNGNSDTTVETIQSSDNSVLSNSNVGLEDIITEQAKEQKQYSAATTYLAVNDNAVNVIASMLMAGTKEKDVTSYNIQVNDFENLWSLAINKDRMVYDSYLSGVGYSISYYEATGIVTKVKLNYDETIATHQQIYQQLKNRVDSIISNVPSGLSDPEKVLYIHDYLVNNCEYDYINLQNNSVPIESFHAYGTLVKRISVCAGYAQAFCILMDQLGIENQYVTSESMNHAWNMVKLGGNWYHVDATFDDPVYPDPTYDYMGRVSHRYFLRTDNEMKNDKHTSWDSGYPVCTTSTYSNIYAKNIDSPIVYVNNNWYYIYGGKLYQGNPFGTSIGSSAISDTVSYTTLGAYKNILYAADSTKLYRINGSNKTVLLSQTSDPFNEMSISDSGIVYYNTNNNKSVMQYQIPNVVVDTSLIKYQTHVQDVGWQGLVSDGALSGTQGRGLRLEGIKISLNTNSVSGNVSYKTHVQDYGWMSAVSNGALSGTTGESKRLEAIQINLSGDVSYKYDIYYRVHVQDFGWLGWAKNGQSAGSAGYCKRLEAIQIMLVSKGASAPGSTSGCYYDSATDPNVNYCTHVQDYGWQGYVSNGSMSGTSGQSKRLEAIKIYLNNCTSGGITYSTHVQDYGWMSSVNNGAMSGTSGQSKRLEAIRINLTGTVANQYDIYYRVHAQDYGWLGWTKNGQSAGTAGLSKRLEAIEIKIVRKGDAAPGSTYNSFISR